MSHINFYNETDMLFFQNVLLEHLQEQLKKYGDNIQSNNVEDVISSSLDEQFELISSLVKLIKMGEITYTSEPIKNITIDMDYVFDYVSKLFVNVRKYKQQEIMTALNNRDFVKAKLITEWYFERQQFLFQFKDQ